MYFPKCWTNPLNQRTEWSAHTPARSPHKLGHTICCTDASTFCLLSRPMKLILFICMFASVFTAWHRLRSLFPSMPSPYSTWYVCVVCEILISCFICRLTSSVNKQDPLLPPSLWHLSASVCVCVGCQTVFSARVGLGEASCSSASCRRVDSEGK